MIRTVRISNFRCIREATLTLEPLTVLVGPNAAGKSTILKALDPRFAWSQADLRDECAQSAARVVVTLGDGRDFARHSVGTGTWAGETYARFRLDLDTLRAQNPPSEANELGEHGENLVDVFATLDRRERDAVATQLCRFAPVFSDVDVVPTNRGHRTFRFQDRWKPKVSYAPDEVSDGAMLLLAYLTLQYRRPSLDIIAIEEPDRGLHPYLVGQLMALFRDMSAGKIDPKPTQIILTTHSPELLDHARPEEVRFLSRDKAEGSMRIRQVDPATPGWTDAFREYGDSLGSVWLSGGLGGVPGE